MARLMAAAPRPVVPARPTTVAPIAARGAATRAIGRCRSEASPSRMPTRWAQVHIENLEYKINGLEKQMNTLKMAHYILTDCEDWYVMGYPITCPKQQQTKLRIS